MDIRESLELHEGRRTRVYKCTAGKRTIGVGHNIDAKGLPEEIEEYLEQNGKITDDMIDSLLDQDIEDAAKDARRLYPNLDTLSESRYTALVDFVFNVGYGTARTFKNTNAAINSERWDDAADLILESKYARQVGKRAEDIAEWLRDG